MPDDLTDAERVAAWPRVPDEVCMVCRRRGWCTWTLARFMRLCDDCLECMR